MTDQRKPGRPFGSTSSRPIRELRKQLRWTEEEWEAIEFAAKAKGQTVANWQRRELLRMARG